MSPACYKGWWKHAYVPDRLTLSWRNHDFASGWNRRSWFSVSWEDTRANQDWVRSWGSR